MSACLSAYQSANLSVCLSVLILIFPLFCYSLFNGFLVHFRLISPSYLDLVFFHIFFDPILFYFGIATYLILS